MNSNKVAIAFTTTVFAVITVAALIAQEARIKELESDLRIKERSLKRWKGHFQTVLKRVPKDELPTLTRTLMDDIQFDAIIKDF